MPLTTDPPHPPAGQEVMMVDMDWRQPFIDYLSEFLWILHQGARACAYSARIKVPECVQNSKGSHAQIEGNHHNTNAGDKISLLIAEIPTSLVQTNQKACSAHTGDEWNRQWRRRGRRGAPG
jgi:hypothetical protein